MVAMPRLNARLTRGQQWGDGPEAPKASRRPRPPLSPTLSAPTSRAPQSHPNAKLPPPSPAPLIPARYLAFALNAPPPRKAIVAGGRLVVLAWARTWQPEASSFLWRAARRGAPSRAVLATRLQPPLPTPPARSPCCERPPPPSRLLPDGPPPLPPAPSADDHLAPCRYAPPPSPFSQGARGGQRDATGAARLRAVRRRAGVGPLHAQGRAARRGPRRPVGGAATGHGPHRPHASDHPQPTSHGPQALTGPHQPTPRRAVCPSCEASRRSARPGRGPHAGHGSPDGLRPSETAP